LRGRAGVETGQIPIPKHVSTTLNCEKIYNIVAGTKSSELQKHSYYKITY
jgi:hypothetical protein